MCLATLSTKAGKRLYAAPLALPHPRGFISLTTEQQQLETANQHAVSKGRLRWQLRARAMLSACCHLVIALGTRGTASQLVGRLACQQTLPPPSRSCSDAYMGEESWMNPPIHTRPNPCVMFFSLLTPPLPLFLPPPPSNSPLPQMLGKKSQNNNKQAAWCVCCFWWVLLMLLSSFSPRFRKRCPHASRERMLQAGRLVRCPDVCCDSLWRSFLIEFASVCLLFHSG